MVEVNERTANWRLFGGGGLLVGGALALVGVLLNMASLADVGVWLTIIGWALIGVALFFVAFGQTGSNGAVGASGWGKAVLVIAGLAALVTALFVLLAVLGIALPEVLWTVVVIVFAAALLLSAIAIFGRGVAKGIAKWALFVPAIAAVLLAVDVFAPINASSWIDIVFTATIALTGLFYLLNKLDVK